MGGSIFVGCFKFVDDLPLSLTESLSSLRLGLEM